MSEETPTNVVNLFGAKRQILEEPKTMAEVKETVDNVRKFHCDETTGLMAAIIIENIYMSAFMFKFDESTTFHKDVALVTESVRSLLYKYYGMEHPLQKIADENFELLGENMVKFKNTDLSSDVILDEIEDEEEI